MGTLYEHKTSQIDELRETYHGVLLILRHFIAKDTYTENHSYRVSVYAATIAMSLNLPHERVEDVRAAALLHDIGKLDVSRELLYKAARLTKEEYEQMQQHVPKGVKMLEPVGGSLRRVIPIVLAHHDKFDGTGYHPTSRRRHSDRGADPLGGRRLRLADERSAVPKGDVALRGEGHHRQGLGHRLRSAGRGRIHRRIPTRRAGGAGGGRLDDRFR